MDEITEPRASANPRSEPTLAGSGPAPRNREVDILSAVSAQVYRAPDVPTLLRTALAELLGGLGLTAGWIFLGDKAEEGLHLAAAQGLSALYVEQVSRTGLLTCLCHEVFATGYNMVAHNTKQCPRMPHLLEDDAVPVAHACVPLQLEGRSRGVLNVAARPGEEFDDRALLFLQAVALQISLGLEAARHRDAERRAFRELRDAQSRLVQGEKMAGLGIFAAGLAHEVRNPLNSISLQLARLERKTRGLEPSLAGEITSLARIIREELDRLDALVSDFLLFSRPSQPDRKPTSLPGLVQEVVGLLAPEAQLAGVSLEVRSVGAPLPLLPLDAGRMKQVALNLVRNSIEAMPAGGKVTIECGLVNNRPQLVVHDTGPGLPLGLDVFQLFVTTKPGGTGLGLAIAQQIVLEHEGELAAGNRAGQGASFTVTLPLFHKPGGQVP